MEQATKRHTLANHIRIATTRNARKSYTQFNVGQYCTVEIPAESRAKGDLRRAFAQVINIVGNPHRYKLQTAYGTLKHRIHVNQLNAIKEHTFNPFPEPLNTSDITLGKLSRLNSSSIHVAVSCNYREDCSTRRYACFKADEPCTIYYHRRKGDPDYHCNNYTI